VRDGPTLLGFVLFFVPLALYGAFYWVVRGFMGEQVARSTAGEAEV
jgi:Na+-transporting NADH:ubiquinone oxidoreductase subunit NqrB